jgi:AraC-like DNA-binding protein
MPCVLVFTQRDRVRTLVRDAFPRRRTRLVIAKSAQEFGETFRGALVDATLVDFGNVTEETWNVSALAREFPSVPFFALLPMRLGDGPLLARCASLEFADVVMEGIDDLALRDLLVPYFYSVRFAVALEEPPEVLHLDTPMRLNAWRYIVAHAGRPVRTAGLAESIGVTREHLSRTFSSDAAPNLKRVIDLVRLISAAELAKNPGYDTRDVARILGFASASHLSTTAQRVVGTKPTSLARLRTIDLIARFSKGRTRSRS